MAKKLIRACRSKGLDTIAITYHHDLVFYKFIKWAIENETGKFGEPLKKEEQIVVFPGIELSLSTPSCQALLIMDAGFPVDQLSVSPNPEKAFKLRKQKYGF